MEGGLCATDFGMSQTHVIITDSDSNYSDIPKLVPICTG